MAENVEAVSKLDQAHGKVTVAISAAVVSAAGTGELITYSLGSCLGLTIYDPAVRVGGLIHCMLPASKTDPEKAKNRPAMFVDTGVVELLNAIFDSGGQPERLIIKAAGCAAPLDSAGRFRIGERNLTIVRKVLWNNDLIIGAEDVGGNQPRTMSLELETGRTVIRTKGAETEL